MTQMTHLLSSSRTALVLGAGHRTSVRHTATPQPGLLRSARAVPVRALAAPSQGVAPRFKAGQHTSAPVPLVPGGEEQIPGYGKAWTGHVPAFYAQPTAEFPRLLCADAADLTAFTPQVWGAAARPFVQDALDESGVAIVRGAPLAKTQDYRAFLDGMGFEKARYVESFIQRKVETGLYDATANPDFFLLSPHNENVFFPTPPGKIIFCMEQPATGGGGETILVRNRDLTAAVGADIIEHFRNKGGVRYSRWYPSAAGKDTLVEQSPGPMKAMVKMMPTWNSWTHSNDHAMAEAHFKGLGLDVSWDKDGGLHASNVLPATVPDLRTGESLWFNFADSSGIPPYFTITYGDGTPFEPEVQNHIRTARWQYAVAFPLQKGDVIVINNAGAEPVQHGRTPFTGKRKLRVEMCD